MRKDRRPYGIKKGYLIFRQWYANHFLKPACDYLGDYHTIMKPWYVSISGPNIRIGKCATIVGEPGGQVKIGVWSRDQGEGEISIGDYVMISPGVRISSSDQISIGDSVMMADGVYITDSDWHDIYDRTRRADEVTPVIIHNNVWLGDRATILKGVTIGENSVVAARSVVVKDVPANVVVAGNPAKVVKQLEPARGFVTRADYFANPEQHLALYDSVDKKTLAENGYLNWLRAVFFPSVRD